jgi:hypothetical protein
VGLLTGIPTPVDLVLLLVASLPHDRSDQDRDSHPPLLLLDLTTVDLLRRLSTDTTLIELEVLIEIENGQDEVTVVPLLLHSVGTGTGGGAGNKSFTVDVVDR